MKKKGEYPKQMNQFSNRMVAKIINFKILKKDIYIQCLMAQLIY